MRRSHGQTQATNRRFLTQPVPPLAFLLIATIGLSAAAADRPNIVLIMADDLVEKSM